MPRLNFLFDGDLSDIDYTRPNIIHTMNQYSYCLFSLDTDFKNAILSSDILLPDGIGICFLNYFLYGKFLKKIAGADIHQHLMAQLNYNGGKCFYLGSNELTLARIQDRVAIDYPNIICETFSPPFKNSFSDDDNIGMIDKINAFSPDILWVGMTAPKQEKWVYANAAALNVKTIASIGAVFDFFAATQKRPASFWINLGLEWFIRLITEPRRLWKRYLIYGPYFIFLISKAKAALLYNKFAHSS
ncbi:MAG: WecB/TagA/CpsF family glycosyltransferase [Bacteroidetes bacterium]|nr:WecB/TagA/CpsF family glycosyltransferase [Bacteroidota bacterium]